MTLLPVLALAVGACAQSQYLLPSNPGGALPAGVQAPSISGFNEPTVHPSRGGLAVCVSGLVPITASTSENAVLGFDPPTNQSQLTEIVLEFITAGSPFPNQTLAGSQSVGGTFNIGATLCVPANDTQPSDVQVLTHGVGFDRYYWDFAPGYSYVDVATIFGYATLFYDRLGVGVSSKPNPYDVVQAPIQLEILHQLVTKLRSGDLSNTTFSTVIGVGHSYGSVLTEALTSAYPSDVDAAILTGFSTNSGGMGAFFSGLNLAIASQAQPYRFGTLSKGYIIASSAISTQTTFFRAPGFDPNILALADATKGTLTLAEPFTSSIISKPAENFTGPVAVVNGAEDLPFCDGNCSYPTNLAAQVFPALYPNLPKKKTGTYLAPVTGHGLNFHYSAVEAYYYAQNFLKKQGF